MNNSMQNNINGRPDWWNSRPDRSRYSRNTKYSEQPRRSTDHSDQPPSYPNHHQPNQHQHKQKEPQIPFPSDSFSRSSPHAVHIPIPSAMSSIMEQHLMMNSSTSSMPSTPAGAPIPLPPQLPSSPPQSHLSNQPTVIMVTPTLVLPEHPPGYYEATALRNGGRSLKNNDIMKKTTKNKKKEKQAPPPPVINRKTVQCRFCGEFHNLRLSIHLARCAKFPRSLPSAGGERFCSFCQQVLPEGVGWKEHNTVCAKTPPENDDSPTAPAKSTEEQETSTEDQHPSLVGNES